MTTERYYLRAGYQTEWTEVTKAQFIEAEQAAGFHSKFGAGHVATGGFSGRGMQGRVEYVDEAVRQPTQPAPDGGEWLQHVQERIAQRDDSNAMNSACGEYNCPCHYELPKAVAIANAVPKLTDTLRLTRDLLTNQQLCERALCESCQTARQTVIEAIDFALTTTTQPDAGEGQR
jgi:hypothetical protein